MIGQVKWYNIKRGFGFIEGYQNKQSYFFHYTDLVANGKYNIAAAGQPVKFKAEEGKNSPHAVKVTPLSIDDILLEAALQKMPGECFNPVIRSAK